ncbi:hypothetical protein [Burkholderia ubonensis]|uniref:hypothetical protein n=1 Tax=Burkholderia ubonensis TaxID=101571 RepID=UPI000ACF7C93|nr:hypothetical protein [Burkholderia ubonensis]
MLRPILLIFLAFLVNTNAYADWQLLPGSAGMGWLQITANPRCQPRQDTKQQVGRYVVKTSNFQGCGIWVISVDGFSTMVAVANSKSSLKGAKDGLLQYVRESGGTDDDALAKQLKEHHAEVVYRWVSEAKRNRADLETTYKSAKSIFPEIYNSCADAIVMKLTPSAPRYESSQPFVVAFSHQCSFYVTYHPTWGDYDAKYRQDDADRWYQFCHQAMGHMNTTCTDGNKEVQNLSEYR